MWQRRGQACDRTRARRRRVAAQRLLLGRVMLRPSLALLLILPFAACEAVTDGDEAEEVGEVDQPIVGGAIENGYSAAGYLMIATQVRPGDLLGPRYSGRLKCTAVLIAPNVVLTAAHCVDDVKSWEVTKLRFGTGPVGGRTTGVARRVFHPGYLGDQGHDLAVLILKGNVPGVTPATLGNGPAAPSCATRAVGYGRTTYGPAGTPPADGPRLRKSVVQCVEARTGTAIQATGSGGGMCYGDSGGPLFREGTNVVIGILHAFSVAGPNVSCINGNHLWWARTDLLGGFISCARIEDSSTRRACLDTMGGNSHLMDAPGPYTPRPEEVPIETAGSHDPNLTPHGSFDGVGCDGIWGWAQDPDVPTSPSWVHLYVDGAFHSVHRADMLRSDLIPVVGDGYHGFGIPYPDALKDARPHSIGVYAIDDRGGYNPLLPGSNRSLTCHYTTAYTPPPAETAATSHTFFDAGFYMLLNPDLQAHYGSLNFAAATTHWINSGRHEGRNSSPAFTLADYLANNPDIRAVFGTNYVAVLEHWRTTGVHEARISSLAFWADYYLQVNPDVAAAYGRYNYATALDHYLFFGIPEGRRASPWFDPRAYLAHNADLAALYGASNYAAALAHWMRSGRYEGRIAVW
jgi:hypothetical protein